jgi:hypothetical protein
MSIRLYSDRRHYNNDAGSNLRGHRPLIMCMSWLSLMPPMLKLVYCGVGGS